MKEICACCTKWFEESDLYLYSGKEYCTKCFPKVLPRKACPVPTSEEQYNLQNQTEELFIRLYFRKFQKFTREQRKRYTHDHIKKIEIDYNNGYFKVQFDNGDWWCLFPLVDILKELNELFGNIEHYATVEEEWLFKSKDAPHEILLVKKDDYALRYFDTNTRSGGFHLYLFEINEWDRHYYYYGTCLENLPEIPKEVVE
jgi:hypothetical protein